MASRKTGSSIVIVPNGRRLDIVSVEAHRDTRPRIQRCESYPLDDAGLATTLTRLRQGGRLATTCATLLRDGEYHFLSLEAPTLPESAPQTELREAVRWKVKDMVDFPVTAAGVDALRIPPQPGRPAQLLAAVARHTTLRPLIESFHTAKLELTQISVPELAQRNIAHLFETPDRALALLTFGANNGLLTLTCNGALYATRRIDISAPDLARDKSLYERVVLDVQRSLDNFDRNFGQLSLQRLLVLPVPGAGDFLAHLRDNLYQPVETLTISDGLDIDAAPMLGNIATLADALPAIGLALGLGQALDAGTQGGINLFDPALLPQHDPWTARNLGFGLATVGLVCAAWGGWAHWRAADAAVALKEVSPQLQAAHAETQQLTKQIGEHKPDTVLLGQLDDNQNRLQARTEVLALLRKGMSPESGNPAEWLRGFARQVPAGLWLTGFTVNADTSALEIHGRTLDPGLIAEYVKRLNAEKAFQGRTFTALSISGPPAATNTAATASNTAPVQTAGAPPVGAPAQPAPHAGQAKKVAAAATVQYHEFALTSSPADSSVPTGGHS